VRGCVPRPEFRSAVLDGPWLLDGEKSDVGLIVLRELNGLIVRKMAS
jgi:hypothetical protein